jgi:hypothetical protein
MKFRIAAALLLATLASSCALDDLWRQSAESDCDQNYQGTRRIDCNQRVDRQAQENARR